jgi:hypothetical protein
VSGRLKAQWHSVPTNPQPHVWIDLTGRTTVEDVGEGKVYGLNPTTTPVAKEKSKGKRVVHTAEKGMHIMESKLKKKKPEWKH